MKKLILLLLLTMNSCGSYVNTSPQPRVTHILAVNDVGQEMVVPLSVFTTGLNPYYYHSWRFYWRNNWYWGYNWWFYFNDPYWRPIIYNFYYSHPNYYNQGYLYARNNGYRGRNSINYQNRPSVSPRQQNVIRTQNNNVRSTNTPSSVRPQNNNVRSTNTPSSVRPQTPTRSQQLSSDRRQPSGRRG
jgi:hypothetical protein